MPEARIDRDLVAAAASGRFRQRRLRALAAKLTLGPLPRAPSELLDDANGGLLAAAAELDSLAAEMQSGAIEFRRFIESFRSATHESDWQRVLVEPSPGHTVQSLTRTLRQRAVSSGPRANWDSLPDDPFATFGLVELLLPPHEAAVAALARQSGVGALYDGEAEVRGIPPVATLGQFGPDLNRSRDMVWPPGVPLPDGMPPPGAGVRVAVVDSGIDESHPDLIGRVVASADFTGEREPFDVCGHGTHCAGIIGGTGAESRGAYAGIAPHVSLLSARALDSNGNGQTSNLLVALRWALDQGVDVLSMSIGGPGAVDGESLLSRACTTLVERGVVVVVSAGNDGPGSGTIAVPADARGVIAVGAVDRQGVVAPFSSRGPTIAPETTGQKPTLVAPGTDIVSCRSAHAAALGSGSYVAMSGTSMACPHVSGAVAVLLSLARELGIKLAVELIAGILTRTASVPAEKDPDAYGYGMLNVTAALAEVDKMRRRDRRAPAPARTPHAPVGDPAPIAAARTPAMAQAIATDPPGAGVVRATRYAPACGVCGQSINTDLRIDGQCAATACDRPICSSCRRRGTILFCKKHDASNDIGAKP